MNENSIIPLDTRQLRNRLTYELNDSSFTEKLCKQPSHARRLTLLASRAKNEFESDPISTLSVAQDLLLEKKLITAATHAAFQPLPKKIRRPGTAAELALYSSLREVLHQKLYLLKNNAHVEELAGGFLVLALIFEGGLLSRREIQGFLTAAADQGLRVMGGLRYVNIPSQQEGGYTLDSRRVHLSPALRALLLRQTPAGLLALAASPDKALRYLGRSVGIPKLGFTAARNAMAAHCEHCLLLPLWLITWMCHDGNHSSSLVEDCWLRLNGYQNDPTSKTTANSHTAYAKNTVALDGCDGGDEESATVQESGPSFDPTQPDANDHLFAKIGRILRQPGASPVETRRLIAELTPLFDEIGKTFPSAPLLHDWLLALHDNLKSCSTIRLNFFAIAHRLMAYCGDTGLDMLTQEDIDLIREQLVEDGLSSSTVSNISGALNHLIRFLVQKGINTTLTPVATGIAVARANARILQPKDIKETIEYINSARCRLAPNHRRATQDLLVLCFHTGLRRQEALHLQWRQVKGLTADICVRNTVANRLKTISSRRNIPYQLMNLHTGTIQHHLNRIEGGLVIQPAASQNSTPMAPGSDEHRKFGDTITRELHSIMEKLTGDSQITLHVLRHSCATIILLLLMARRHRLHEHISNIPFLQDILDSEAEQLAKDLICPEAYQNDAELAAVRDVLGHASESMTLAHYVHALDILRFATLSGEWVKDASKIGTASGFSDYLCKQHPLDVLLLKQERKSHIKVTAFEKSNCIRFSESDDKAGQLLRQLTAVSIGKDNPELLRSLLRKTGKQDISQSDVRFIIEFGDYIQPLTTNFLKKRDTPRTLRELMPLARGREVALRLCDNILLGESSLEHDELLYYRQNLVNSIHDVLQNSTKIGSGVIRIPNIFTLRSYEFLCCHLMGTQADLQRLFIWKKKSGSHQRTYVSLKEVESMLLDKTQSHQTVFAKLDVAREQSDSTHESECTEHRSPLSTLVWVMATYYLLHAGPYHQPNFQQPKNGKEK